MWLKATKDDGEAVVINTDLIQYVSKREPAIPGEEGGTIIHVGREWVFVKDPFDEVVQALLEADAKSR